MKLPALFFGLSSLLSAATFTCAATTTGNASNASLWANCNGGIPDNGRADGNVYIVTVTASSVPVTVTVDQSMSWGSATTQIGNAYTLTGASGSVQAILKIANGVSLTLAGENTTTGATCGNTNSAGYVTQYGVFQPLAGSTISINSNGDTTACIYSTGTILADATGGSPITFTVPSGNYLWNNATSGASGTVVGANVNYPTWAWAPIDGKQLQVWLLPKPYVSNAAGTGPGHCGDSSLVLTHTAGDTLSEVCVPDPTVGGTWNAFAVAEALGTPGTYWVNYQGAYILANLSAVTTTTFNYAYDYMSAGHGYTIEITGNHAYAQGIFRNVVFQYAGNTTNNNYFLQATLFAAGQFFGTGSATLNRTFEATNNQFLYCGTAVALQETGGADAPILLNDNLLIGSGGTAAGGGAWTYPEIHLYSTGSGSYTNIEAEGNVCLVSPNQTCFGIRPAYQAVLQLSDILVNGNYFRSDNPLPGGSTVYAALCSDCQIANNIIQGSQVGNSGYGMQTWTGTPGHPILIFGNTMYGVQRAGVLKSYTNVYQNQMYTLGHHGFVTCAGAGSTLYCSNENFHDNLYVGVQYNHGDSMNFGYNGSDWVESVSFYHNTLVLRNTNTSTSYDIGLCDFDSATYLTNSHLVIRDNLDVANGGPLVGRPTLTSTIGCKVGVDMMQNNAIYGSNESPPYGPNVNRGAVILEGGSAYNMSLTRNVLGTSLWNPSYSTNQTTGALQLVSTFPTGLTLAWSIDGVNYGTPVQLVWPSSATVYTVASATLYNGADEAGVPYVYDVITVAGTPWSTNPTNGGCPVNLFAYFLTGAAAGQTAAIVIVPSSSSVRMLPPHQIGTSWVLTPGIGDQFVIISSDVTLPDAASGTIEVGIDPRTLPLTPGTYTDTGISVLQTDLNGVNPDFASPPYNSIFGQYTPRNPAFCTAASDGTTIGALPCKPLWMAPTK